MAIYRSQKTSWEDSLRTHTKPVLVTTSTPFLSSLDLSTISTTGVKKSQKPKTLGLAATIRHARNEAEQTEKEEAEMREEEVEERVLKKAKREEKDGLMVGFDYEPKQVVVKQPTVEKKVTEKKKETVKEKVKKVVGRAFKGDREKRPKSAEGWWEE